MAVVTVTATSNADGTMTVTSTDTAGLKIVVLNPGNESSGNDLKWVRPLANFIRGSLYP
jgi:hypothetical protein